MQTIFKDNTNCIYIYIYMNCVFDTIPESSIGKNWHDKINSTQYFYKPCFKLTTTMIVLVTKIYIS